MVADGAVTSDEYMKKLEDYVGKLTNNVKGLNNKNQMLYLFNQVSPYYKTKKGRK
jgi:DNA topoisomerase-3